MGIQGLLPLLKSIQKPTHLRQFAGQTIGVDAYGWLHRGTVACAVELATGKPTTKYVDFAMGRVRMLKYFGITPYLIFDGDYLPSKSKTEIERSARRKESKKKGMELLKLGKTSQAYQEFQKSIDVTPEMAGLLIEALKREEIQYVVAPYEADSQMVYLERKGIIQGILSEDSDLLVFGAKKLLTKLDQYGECVMIRKDDFTACREVSLVGWSDKEFRYMAIMSGCDYLAGIDKLGLKTAHRLVRKYKTMDRIIRGVQFDAKFKVPNGYMEAFMQAERTFLHQWVFCPEAKRLVNFTALEDGLSADDLPFIGEMVEANVAARVATGELHPHTKERIQLPVAPQRWGAPPQRKPAPVETPELKKHKSIDSFFKKRTPLAELDPNLFTGSPSQQELSRRASGSSWTATSVESTPQAILARPSTLPSSAPVTGRRAFSDNLSAKRSDTERASKRLRLCADGSSPVSQKHASLAEYGKSKFFGDPTPSKRSKTQGSKKAQFDLWSDDSVDEALSQLPMPEGFGSQPKSKSKITVFNDHEEQSTRKEDEQDETAAHAEDTQVTQVAQVFSPGAEAEAGTPPSSEEADDEPFDLLDASIKAEVHGLRERFAFGRSTSVVKQSPEGPRSQSRLNSKKAQSKAPVRRQKTASIEVTKELEKSEEIIVPGSDAVEPPEMSPTKVDAEPSSTMAVTGGSEDFLVSESEAEGSEQGTPRAIRPVLDLGRFAFGA